MSDPSNKSTASGSPPVGLDPEAILALTDDEDSIGENGTEAEESKLGVEPGTRGDVSPCVEESIRKPQPSVKSTGSGYLSDVEAQSASICSQEMDSDPDQRLRDDEDLLAKVLQARSDAAAEASTCRHDNAALQLEKNISKHAQSPILDSKKEAIETEIPLVNSVPMQSELERSILGDTEEGGHGDAKTRSTGAAPVLSGRRAESVPGAYALASTGETPPRRQIDEEETRRLEMEDFQNSRGCAVANLVATGLIPIAELEEDRRRNRRRKQWHALGKQASILMCMGLALVAVVAIPIAIVLRRNKTKSESSAGIGSTSAEGTETPAPEVAPLTKLQDYLQEILSQYTIEAIQNNIDSPQGRAYQWILDDLQAFNGTLEQWRILQRFGLATLFYSTVGEDWTHNDKWMDHSVHECLWFSQSSFIEGQFGYAFVDLSHTNPCEIPQNETNTTLLEDNLVYQHLWLRSNNLKGVLPPELFLLTSLKSLTTRKSGLLGGTIPTMLGMLTSLEAISLSGTQLSGSIPTEVGALSLLRSLHLVYAKLEGPIPSEIGKLTKLHDMLVDSNSITGTLPIEFANLSDLAWFTSYLNQLTGTIPDWINNQTMPHLEEFQIDFNHFTGTIPTELGTQGDSLLTLWLAGNHLSGTIPSEVGNLVNLIGFYPYENALTGSIPSEVGKCVSLVGTSLGSNHLTGTIPTELAELTGVRYLKLDGNELNGPIPSELGLLKFPHPKGGQLSFHDNQLSGTIPLELALPTALVSLNFGHNMLLGAIPTQFGLLPNVTEFNVTHNPLLSGIIPEPLCQLESLVFDCTNHLCGCDCSCTSETEHKANTT